MNRSIKLSQAITYILAVLAVATMVIVWPLKLVHRSTVSKSDEILQTESGECSSEHMIAQVFVAKGTELEDVKIYVCSDSAGEDISLSIYDGTLKQVYEKTMTIDGDLSLPGMVEIPVSLYTERGAAYILSVAGVDSVLTVGLEDHATTTNSDVFSITYDGMEDPAHNMIIRYKYYIDFTWWQILLIDIGIVVCILLVSLLINKTLAGKPGDKDVIVQKVLQYTLNPLVLLVSGILLWMIFPGKVFSDLPINCVFWDIGIVISAALALYEINYKRTNDKPLVSVEYIKANYKGWITAISIGYTLWYCFEYMNGFYDIHHTYAVRRVLICFIITLLSTFEKEEFIKIYNLIWLIIGGPIVYFYAKPYIGSGEQELEYKLNAAIIYLGILLCMNVIYNIVQIVRKRVKVAKINIWYAIPYAVFLIAACVLANTREWPGFFVLLVSFLLFRLWVWKDRNRWLRYLCDGVIVNFLLMLAFSLLHRPYYGYIYYRYNMTYFTVTMTATHLTLCLAACFVKLYEKKRTCEDKRELIPWLILLGTVGNYALFTLSRTAYFAIFVMIVVTLVIAVAVDASHGKRLYSFCALALAMIASVLIMFVPVSTYTRVIPVLYDDPVIYEYEPCIVTAYKGTDPSYRHYMDLPRFIEVFNSKVFGIGDATASMDYMTLDGYYSLNFKEYASLGTHSFSMLYESEDVDIPEENDEDISNGRMDIYRSYMEQMNMWGHDTMGAILKDGSEAAHAHNVLLQVMFDHGIVYGIYFAIFMLFTVIFSIVEYAKNRTKRSYTLLCIAVLTGFLSAGLVEWIYHPCNPFGLVLILSISSFVIRCEKDD